MTCEGCKYWSELVASSFGCEPVKALCLNERSTNYNVMVNSGCPQKVEGIPVDSPKHVPPSDEEIDYYRWRTP